MTGGWRDFRQSTSTSHEATALGGGIDRRIEGGIQHSTQPVKVVPTVSGQVRLAIQSQHS